ncbi:MAG TPA: chemotaxis response regulator protein-glutamate methylesterase [Candidatus Acidoferrales bacterium]|nr:chemotaxis response regulator protein-glutamate methylesterase [Candidatus Acidoferrales bacterium]
MAMNTALDKKIRVLIVDDSAFMCRVLRDIISADPQLEVAGQGRDGRDAVAMAESLKPDVITMDINMPHIDGLQATELIMSQHPRPIVIVSSESRDGAASTLRALELGAIDFVSKPSGGVDLDMRSVKDELTRKLKLAAKVRVVRTATRSKTAGHAAAGPSRADASIPAAASQNGGKSPIVVIAASTGGPAAVTQLVSGLPKDLAAAVILVLHMPAAFTAPFTSQLSEVSELPVKEAAANETVQSGTIYLCPGSSHLRVSLQGKILLDAGARIDGYRPCADVAFETVASYARGLAIGVVLTGMGNDAAKGALDLKSKGGYVLAQDEATSMIFGMPAEAIKAHAVDEVLPLRDIATAIEKRVAKLCKGVLVGAR